MMKEALDKELLIKRLGRSVFTDNIILLQTIDSTNILAKDLAFKGAPHGTVVLTEEQTAGKGRLDRKWLSPSNENLLFTILLRPPFTADKIFPITMMLAVSAIEAIKDMTGIDALIKWPNDLYVGKKKLGGMLTEFSFKEGITEYVIIGLGLNVNWMPGEGGGPLYPTTSLLNESGKRVKRNELLVRILKRFESFYEEALSGRLEVLYSRWNELSMVIGKDVEIVSSDEAIKGRVVAIDHSGALILKKPMGEELRILSGDVSLRL